MKYFLLVFLAVAVAGAGCVERRNDSGTNRQGSLDALQGDTELNVRGHDLMSISPAILSRTDLTKLDISKNRLTGAPPSQIGQLKNLVSLDLSYNELTGLPAEIGQLDKLEILDVSHNALTGLPLELGNLSHLRILNVSGNPFSVRDLDAIAAKLPKTEIIR